MEYKIFLDTNIFLDHLLARNEYSIELIRKCEEGRLTPFASSATFFALAYFVGKYVGINTRQVLVQYSDMVELIPTTKENIYAAYQSNFNDLEDAFQFYTARNESRVEYFVTNNIKDFKSAEKKLRVVTPESLLKLLESSL